MNRIPLNSCKVSFLVVHTVFLGFKLNPLFVIPTWRWDSFFCGWSISSVFWWFGLVWFWVGCFCLVWFVVRIRIHVSILDTIIRVILVVYNLGMLKNYLKWPLLTLYQGTVHRGRSFEDPFDRFCCIPLGFENKPEDEMMCWTMYSSVFLLAGFGFGRTMTHRLMGIILLPNRVVHRPRCVRTCPFACFDWSTGDCVQSDFE